MGMDFIFLSFFLNFFPFPSASFHTNISHFVIIIIIIIIIPSWLGFWKGKNTSGIIDFLPPFNTSLHPDRLFCTLPLFVCLFYLSLPSLAPYTPRPSCVFYFTCPRWRKLYPPVFFVVQNIYTPCVYLSCMHHHPMYPVV